MLFFPKFANSEHQPGSAPPINLVNRYDDDPKRHGRVTDGGLNYGEIPWRIPRIWSWSMRMNAALDSKSMSSSMYMARLPHQIVNMPVGRGGQSVGARGQSANLGDYQRYIPAVFIGAAPIGR